MRVLVTGHSGYIGAVMVPVLESAGHHVVGLDNGLFVDCTHGPPIAEPEAERLDLRDIDRTDLEGFDAVVHLAALSNDPLGDLEPEHTYHINHRASIQLAEAARAAGVSRFLYSSSCSIYGAASVDEAVDENAPMRPVTPYAVSKVRVEDDLRELADESFSTVTLRNATAYGWSPRLRCDLVLNDLVARAFLSGEIRVLSDGTPWRPLVHVEDIARAFLAALEAPREAVHDQAFNVGTASENYQIRDLAEMVADAVPGAAVAVTGETGPDPRSYRVDFSKISERLPTYRPVWTATRGVAQLLEAFSRYGLTERQHVLVFRRLAWLQRLREQGLVDGTLRWRTANPA
jgi:nucleoside-diphosphate-sugar epimerase